MADKIRDYKNFYYLLFRKNCIDSVWKNVLEFLDEDIGVDDDRVLMLLCMYFSLLDDGNVCMSLDEKELSEKWANKWRACSDRCEKSRGDDSSDIDFGSVIADGIRAVNDLFEQRGKTSGELFAQLFCKKGKWFYSNKYYNAVKVICDKLKTEDGSSKIFDNVQGVKNLSDKSPEIEEIIRTCESASGGKISLDLYQGQCIKAGVDGENFIITGGPGTGKTTVVTYMLCKILEDPKNKGCFNPVYEDWQVKFAAPSGKAAQRIKESIATGLENLKESFDDKIRSKLLEAPSLTIEKLLNVDSNGKFRVNEYEKFDEKTILVIDEASMIDLLKFSAILKSIPEKREVLKGIFAPRVFILGDDKQLPSVESGAVLGDIFAQQKEILIELKKSRRFNDDSQAGRLAATIQSKSRVSDIFANSDYITEIDEKNFTSIIKNDIPRGDYPCFYISPKDATRTAKALREQVKSTVETFSEQFYNLDLNASVDKILDLNKNAQILCTQRSGVLGLENINKIVISHLFRCNKAIAEKYKYHPFFPGEKVLITKNLHHLNLFNGDTGIVLEDKSTRSDALYVYFNDRFVEDDTNPSDRLPLSIPISDIPLEAIEPSFAMTIHKSQGSGYRNILVFLPNDKDNPLLTRQIFYTALTRTEGRTVIFASPAIMQYAIDHPEIRDTGLNL